MMGVALLLPLFILFYLNSTFHSDHAFLKVEQHENNRILYYSFISSLPTGRSIKPLGDAAFFPNALLLVPDNALLRSNLAKT